MCRSSRKSPISLCYALGVDAMGRFLRNQSCLNSCATSLTLISGPLLSLTAAKTPFTTSSRHSTLHKDQPGAVMPLAVRERTFFVAQGHPHADRPF